MSNLKKHPLWKKDAGFTLVELMMALALGGILMAAVMTSFRSQHDVYLAQDEVVTMQQNARVALDTLASEIRMAGYNPRNATNAGIVTATISRFGFGLDRNENGTITSNPVTDPNELLIYGFSAADDANGDGVADGVSAPLRRNTGTATGAGGSGFQPVAENLRVIDFRYLNEHGAQTADLTEIRAIKVSLMVLVAQPDPRAPSVITNKPTGQDPDTGLNWDDPKWNPLPGYRSLYLTTTVQCRNLGL